MVGGLETLSGVDGVFLNIESAATPMHVGSLHLFETPPGHRGSFYTAVRRMMASRMVPVLRRHLVTMPLGLANPVWRRRATGPKTGPDTKARARSSRTPRSGRAAANP